MPGRYYAGAGPWQGRHLRYTGYQPDRVSIARCAVGPEIHHALSRIVGGAIDYAQLIAPNDSGQYQSSFGTEVVLVPDIPYRVHGEPMARWSGRVVNTDPDAIYVEVGSAGAAVQHSGARVMRRTLEWIESVSG